MSGNWGDQFCWMGTLPYSCFMEDFRCTSVLSRLCRVFYIMMGQMVSNGERFSTWTLLLWCGCCSKICMYLSALMVPFQVFELPIPVALMHSLYVKDLMHKHNSSFNLCLWIIWWTVTEWFQEVNLRAWRSGASNIDFQPCRLCTDFSRFWTSFNDVMCCGWWYICTWWAFTILCWLTLFWKFAHLYFWLCFSKMLFLYPDQYPITDLLPNMFPV